MPKLSFVTTFRSIPAALSILIAVTTLSMASCTKDTTQPSDNAKFIGTWVGYQVCSYKGDTAAATPVTKYIGTGSDGNSLNIGISFGENICYKATYFVATVKGYSFSFADQGFSDNCGDTYIIGGTGSVSTNGKTLTMTTETQSLGTTTCIFTGALQ